MMAISHRHIPAHLKQYIAVQDYRRYTPIDHAVWRYVMRRNVDFLSRTAHGAYLCGLDATGIHIDTVPNVDEMNERLCELGWGAVVVDGLIPSVAFFDFQAHGLLPISVDIRTLEHIEYTPAPDIIHEAAGHAPILFDPKYADYVRRFGEIGSKALGTAAGHEVFDALRRLTIVMENPASTTAEIAEAERILAEKRALPRGDSEESLVSRLYWWTVEYGLMGSVTEPKIYGAGLLSSVAEGKNCLSDDVLKLPFDLETCIRTRYDVTKPQPQLFVCESFDELLEAVERLSERMAYKVGGTESLLKAVASGRTTTMVYSSGLQVSGTLVDVFRDDTGEAVYLRTSGPTALAVDGRELAGHGVRMHGDGFGSPIGRLRATSTPLEALSDEELVRVGIVPGQLAELAFASGVTVRGVVQGVRRECGRLVLVSFSECTVVWGNQTLFGRSWGTYDMAVGAGIESVFAGAADGERFFDGVDRLDVTAMNPDTTVQTTEPPLLERLYSAVRTMRETSVDAPALRNLLTTLDATCPTDWLLRLEVLEVVSGDVEFRHLADQLRRQLHALQTDRPHLRQLIDNGLKLIDAKESVGAH